MILIFLLGIVVGCLLGWWGSGKWTSFTSSDDGTPAATEGFAAGLVAGFITLIKSAALVVFAVVVLFVLALLIAPLPR